MFSNIGPEEIPLISYHNFDLDMNDQKSKEVLLGCNYLKAIIFCESVCLLEN